VLLYVKLHLERYAFAVQECLIYTFRLFSQYFLSRSAIVHAETHISAESAALFENPRVSRPHEDQRRPKSPGQTARQGTKARLRKAWLPRVVVFTMEHLQGKQVPIGGGTIFSALARLRRHSDFENVYSKGHRLFSTHLTFFFVWREPAATLGDTARIGFTVPKAFGSAVVRNRMRRRMRDAVRLESDSAPSGVDAVIHPRKSAMTVEFGELREEVARAFAKMKSQRASKQSG
jgi:ribonuclease P protein component